MARGKLCGSRCAGWLESTITGFSPKYAARDRELLSKVRVSMRGLFVRMNIAWTNLESLLEKIWRRTFLFDKIFISSFIIRLMIRLTVSMILIFRSFVNNFTNLRWDKRGLKMFAGSGYFKILLRIDELIVRQIFGNGCKIKIMSKFHYIDLGALILISI